MKLRFWMYACLLLSGINACSKDNEPQIVSTRTILVYISADNSLSKFAYSNMENIVKGVSDDNLNNGVMSD